MKTAVSLPDATFQRATASAAKLGISRSELFATALDRYLEELESGVVVQDIDRAVDLAANDDSNRVAAAVGRRRLSDDDGNW
jgi:metal-responsive CopG/Arc/MetJ family transcriptional regulator